MTNRQKVLLVEADKEYSSSLSGLLSEHGYEVLISTTGEEALRMALSHCPEFILTELELPDMNGLEVVRSIREWSLNPVLVVTDKAEEADVVEALDAGADDYIIKPYRPLELLARMRTAFRHTRTGSGNLKFASEGKIVVGRLTIDYNKYRVYVDKTDAGLTQNEFRMVGLLAKYAGKVLTYEQIIRELWGPNADGDDNQVLRVNMTNIRRKIEDDALNPKYLFTENGVGYRMVTQEEAAQWDLQK
ncbi:MAG: response regulator transcription factor [Lachnospiraceae bacterium]|nr:response regulator transcription factor [Lachnospiraceae bacterium]